MCLALTTARPLVLAHSKALAADRPEKDFGLVHGACSLAERQRAAYRDRELAHACGSACAAARGEPPSRILRRRNCGYSPLVQLAEWPARGHQELVSPLGISGEPELARSASQSHGPSADLLSLSGGWARVVGGQALADWWRREYEY